MTSLLHGILILATCVAINLGLGVAILSIAALFFGLPF